jgi:hypothetical protein
MADDFGNLWEVKVRLMGYHQLEEQLTVPVLIFARSAES